MIFRQWWRGGGPKAVWNFLENSLVLVSSLVPKGETNKNQKHPIGVLPPQRKRSFAHKKGRWRGWLTLMIYPTLVLCIFVGTKESSCIYLQEMLQTKKINNFLSLAKYQRCPILLEIRGPPRPEIYICFYAIKIEYFTPETHIEKILWESIKLKLDRWQVIILVYIHKLVSSDVTYCAYMQGNRTSSSLKLNMNIAGKDVDCWCKITSG